VEGATLMKELVKGGGESFRQEKLQNKCAVGARGRLYAHTSLRKQGNGRGARHRRHGDTETF
jgi:hypothetical protein